MSQALNVNSISHCIHPLTIWNTMIIIARLRCTLFQDEWNLLTSPTHTFATLRLSIRPFTIYSSYNIQSEHTDECIIYMLLIVCYDDGTHFCANGHAQFVFTMKMHLREKRPCTYLNEDRFSPKEDMYHARLSAMGVLGSEKFTANINMNKISVARLLAFL